MNSPLLGGTPLNISGYKDNKNKQNLQAYKGNPAPPAVQQLYSAYLTASISDNVRFGKTGSAPPPIPVPSELRDDTVETVHGIQIADTFRPMEKSSPALTDWIKANNHRTEQFLRGTGKARQSALDWCKTRQKEYANESLPERYGPNVFFLRREGNQKQHVLYVKGDGDTHARPLIDFNALSPDESVGIQKITGSLLHFGELPVRGFFPSPDGKWVAYITERKGGGFGELRIRNVQTAQDLPEVITNVKFLCLEWDMDSQGFVYNYYHQDPGSTAKKQTAHILGHHRLGNAPSSDQTIYKRPDFQHPRILPLRLQPEDPYLFLFVMDGFTRKPGLYYRAASGGFRQILEPGKTTIIPFYRSGSTVYATTNLDADMGRIVTINLKNPNPENWKTLVHSDQKPGQRLVGGFMAGGKLLAQWEDCGANNLELREPDGSRPLEIKLPELSSVTVGQTRPDERYVLLECEGYQFSPRQYRLDTRTGQLAEVSKSRIDLSDRVEIKRIQGVSKDGTAVPTWLLHSKGKPRDGSAATILHGYGAFMNVRRPIFSFDVAHWLDRGGSYAIACIRGGGEFGHRWHEAGAGQNKTNTFDDFAASARALIDQKYTSPERLAIKARSAGGLLTAATMIRNPDLFNAVIADVPVLDMPRRSLGGLGPGTQAEYGNPDNDDDFKNLMGYSPLHNIQPTEKTTYPPVLLTTALNDTNVPPSHAYKFLAALQAKGHANSYLQVEPDAGHVVYDRPLDMRIRHAADEYAFLVRALGSLN